MCVVSLCAGGASEEGWDSGSRWTEVLRALVGVVNGALVAQAIQATLDITAKDKDRCGTEQPQEGAPGIRRGR
jgi:hypothetical protein